MNAIAALNARATRPHALTGQPPAPPLHAQPLRFGNGRVELQVYPHATEEDRIAIAAALLAGTGFRVVKED